MKRCGLSFVRHIYSMFVGIEADNWSEYTRYNASSDDRILWSFHRSIRFTLEAPVLARSFKL